MNEKTIINGTVEKTYAILIPIVHLLIGVFCFIFTYTMANSITEEDVSIVLGIIFIILAFISFLCMSRYEITVTNKRVYGKTAFGKRVDLPVDSISAVGMSAFRGVSVATSSGNVSFLCIGNNEDVHKAISTLLLNRQESSSASVVVNKQEATQSNADELKKYKELLDSSVITQEEFDAKKKQLLGL